MLLAPVVLLAVLLLARAAFRRKPTRRSTPAPRILIDGSNVMHWAGDGADLAVVRSVAWALTDHGYEVGVIFDANVGYKITDRYMNEATLAGVLGLKDEQIMVSPKGQPADGFLLQAARDMDAPVVTNDRFRDWQDDFPECAAPGRLIHGTWHDGAPQLRMSKGKPQT
ncbi:Zc3h12a-like Ribonuclease NYN domain-containing protein [Shimia aestuarii]|uniref:Zc3h12a-like Ribonuclease NYN domain-containing protein n=1 Tax=Shimia aestuarii TaxID=254406 RepID=A0A1I4HPU5_9RHOB|nr:Zc3h12a-like Ribonuclease NYN domain-containing protein [Shimia aestuarii]